MAQLLPRDNTQKRLLLAQVPMVVLTFETVRPQVDQRLPDAVVNEIIKLGDKGKIDEVNTAARYIARYTAQWADAIFPILEDGVVANLFVKKPTDVAELTKRIGRYMVGAVECLRLDVLADAFSKEPKTMIDRFQRMAKSDRNGYGGVFISLGHVDVATFFLEHPNEFLNLTEYNGQFARYAVVAGINEDSSEILDEHLTGQRTLGQFTVAGISLISGWTIELGRPLDWYHDDSTKRESYLNKLTTEQVLGLLCSNPEFFYTSTNHMLFDRLKKDIGDKSIVQLKKEYKLTDTQLENLIFRAINYDRLVGKQDSLFNEKDIKNIRDVLFKKMNDNQFDEKYYYLFANGIEKIGSQLPDTLAIIEQKIASLKKQLELEKSSDLEKIFYALIYIRATLKKDFSDPELRKLEERKIFNPTDYIATDGKTHGLQVFDREDTEKDHWKLSQTWFEKKYGKPKKGTAGELIYSDSKTEIVLYMGQTKDKNKEFTRLWLNRNSKGVVTFRGHSYNLEKNMPHDIFQNRLGDYIFIPGSCGSAGSTPEYITKNPNTNLRFFSNTSTGRGQVTNALVSALLTQSKPIAFTALLDQNKDGIARNGGNPKTIKVENMGERMLYYMMSKIGTD